MDTENDLSKPEEASCITPIVSKNEEGKDSDATECALESDQEGRIEKHFPSSHTHTLSHELPPLQSSPGSHSIMRAGVLEDGYNWQKYGQKSIMGDEFTRSYYRCRHPRCPAKKELRLSNNGDITDSIYRGEHNHPRPQLDSTVSVECALPVALPNAEGKTIITDIRQMGTHLSNGRGSLKSETQGISSEKYEVPREEGLSLLVRIRDFISLLLTYPMKIEEEGILKSWICAFPEWKAQLLSTHDQTVIDKPLCLPTDKALRCMEGFMPREIIGKIKRGERSISNHNDAIPEAILHLTVDLAVNQLIQTIFSRDYSAACCIRLSTRNLIEKRTVVNKIVSALEEKQNMFGIDKDFLRALWINASEYESNAEIRVQEEINTMMAGSSATQDHDINNMHLVIVVDADRNKKLDLQKVCFPTGTVVLITTEPSTRAKKDDEFRITWTMDLNIRTLDHLLPWEVFCSYVGRSTIRLSMAIQRIAEQIVKECHGHLLATVLVAKYLKNAEDVKRWRVALYKLSNLNPFYDYQDND